MALGLLPERLGRGVEGLEYASDIAPRHAERREFARYRSGVRAGNRSKAAVTASIVRGADRTTPSVGNRTKARRAMRDHDANIAAGLAIDTDAVITDRRLASNQERLDDLE